MKHEERKIKAIEIMEKMDIYKPYIKGFRESDKVCFFERFGGFWVDQEPEIYNKMNKSKRNITAPCTQLHTNLHNLVSAIPSYSLRTIRANGKIS